MPSGLVSVNGFGEDLSKGVDVPEIAPEHLNTFKSNDFSSTIVGNISPLVKYEVINQRFNLRKLLIGCGCNPDTQVMYCPFHDDRLTGKPSAKYHPDTDILYCFSESKPYHAYHALKILYNKDVNKIFEDIWYKMSEEERRNILDKVDPDPLDNSRITTTPDIWNRYKPLLEKFKGAEISYTQFKNGLYKVFDMISKENGGSPEEEVQND